MLNLISVLMLSTLFKLVIGQQQLRGYTENNDLSNGIRERYDLSISEYQTERTCWWNEMCKEEFSSKFKCRCPAWSFCSSPGKYYNAYCSMSGTGYLWSQPNRGSSIGMFYRPPPYSGGSVGSGKQTNKPITGGNSANRYKMRHQLASK